MLHHEIPIYIPKIIVTCFQGTAGTYFLGYSHLHECEQEQSPVAVCLIIISKQVLVVK